MAETVWDSVVSLCVYMSMYMHIYIICVSVCMHICICVSVGLVCLYLCACLSVCLHVCVILCVCVYAYKCVIHVSVSLCISVYVITVMSLSTSSSFVPQPTPVRDVAVVLVSAEETAGWPEQPCLLAVYGAQATE